MAGCKTRRELNGRYVQVLESSTPGRPVYEKKAADAKGEDNLVVRYRPCATGTGSKSVSAGWAISVGMRGEVLATNPREARSPPCLGWQVVTDDGTLVDDPGGFMNKQVGLKPQAAHPNNGLPAPLSGVLFPLPGGAAEEKPPGGEKEKPKENKVDPRLARAALERLDLNQLKGSIYTSNRDVAEYFGHFMVLMHLEHLAEVVSIKKRREKSSADQLVRWGWALGGMRILSTFGRKEAGNFGRRALPGWEDQGTEMAALQVPGYMDLERLRLRRGDSITISHTDPLLDRVGEGTLNDLRPGSVTIQLKGELPEDAREKFWRIDKAANATVYERQMQALLQLTHAAKNQPTVELLTAAPVGLADQWAMKWNSGSGSGSKDQQEDSKRGKERGRGRSRSRSRSGRRGGGEKKAKKGDSKKAPRGSRSRSNSSGSGKKKKGPAAKAKEKDVDAGADSDSSVERQRKKRRMRCNELAETEVNDGREDKLLEARKKAAEVEGMNKSQKAAINAALSRTCAIVQGPPGTGKTSMSVQVLSLWTKVMGLSPVLACSDSNVAVDNICEGLRARGVKAVRVGRPEKVRGVIEDMTLEAELRKAKEQKLVDDAAAAEAKAAEGGDAAEDPSSADGEAKGGGNWTCPSCKNDNFPLRMSCNRCNLAKMGGGMGGGAAVGLQKGLAGGVKGLVGQVKGSFGGGKWGGKGPQGCGGCGGDAGEAAIRIFEDRRTQNRQDYELQMKILREAEVICTTTIAAGMEFLSKLVSFEAILVDEVAQATELSTVVPVILRGAQRLVLVGDHCQLPPAVQSPEAEVRGLSLSVYSRLWQAGGIQPFMLDTQYRSHPKLAEFSSKAFYESQLLSGVEASRRPLPQGVPWPNKDVPIAFINVDAQEEMEGDSKANSVEAQLVASLVGKVFQYGELGVNDVGVVTPYTAQVRRLRQLLKPMLPPGTDPKLMECASVDNFQGREKELIVFSAVRSNQFGNIGFLADWRRLNVMLTRAKRGLLIFGNAKTLRQDPIWERWLNFAEDHGCIISDMQMPAPLPSMMGGPKQPWQQQQMFQQQLSMMQQQNLQNLQRFQGASGGKGVFNNKGGFGGAWGGGGAGAAAHNMAVAAKAALLSQQSGGASAPDRSNFIDFATFQESALPGACGQQLQHQQMLNQMEMRLQMQFQQLQQNQMQVQQLSLSNPMQAQMQMQQLQQQKMQLQQQWAQLEQKKMQLQQQWGTAAAPSAEDADQQQQQQQQQAPPVQSGAYVDQGNEAAAGAYVVQGTEEAPLVSPPANPYVDQGSVENALEQQSLLQVLLEQSLQAQPQPGT
ncbi:unnamed protein product [Polarella glacialis]|uniref:RanBP2-type domain-containing protein n=1 Tax=Polarella glacialis TaxID=89957 RepID=A0A813FEL2_POLGL|nr:unnamed protein product [Polarella glacialis]